MISNNTGDLIPGERQMQYVMTIQHIRELGPGEAGQFGPGNEGRWTHLVECSDTQIPHDPVVNFKQFLPEHDVQIITHINPTGTDAV